MQYYLAFDRRPPDFTAWFESDSIAHAGEKISDLCGRVGLKDIFELFSYGPQNSLCPPGYEEKETPWFLPEEGIEWLTALIHHIEESNSDFPAQEELLADLRGCRGVLTTAKGAGLKWHFEMDV